MKSNYSNFDFNDPFMRTFMMPAVMPDMMQNNQMNMNNQSKFVSPEEGFLRGNLENGTYIPYKNLTYIKATINSEKKRDLYKLQEIAFAAHDINLYLDTNPNDVNAIRLYNEYNKQEQMLNDSFERKYGPIDLSDNEGLSMSPWSWIKEPWPWNE